MKAKAYLLLFFIILILNSCASIKLHSPEVKHVSFPKLDNKVTKSVGDILIQQGTLSTYKGIRVKTDQLNGKVKKGSYKNIGKQQKYEIYEPIPSSGASISISSLISNQAFLAEIDNDVYLAWYGGYGNVVAPRKLPPDSFSFESVDVEETEDFQQTLIYTGKENNIIKFTYREFSGSMARPAYTVDVSYDLNESNRISFKDAVLEIIEATNSSITYIVKRNFS